MKTQKFFLTILFSLYIFLTTIYATEALNDPFQIMEKHVEAIGGMEKVRAEKTLHFEAVIKLAGLEGTLKEWRELPNKMRQELDLKVFKQTTGDDGTTSWKMDANGKVKINKDEATLKNRKLNELINTYEYLNKSSEYFTVTFEGIENVNEKECYVVKIANTINRNYTVNFYDVSNFHRLKSVEKVDSDETHTLFSDFRKVAGLIKPFKFNITTKPTEEQQEIEIMKYQSNLEIDPAVFKVPTDDARDYQFTNNNSAENIPFHYIENHLLINVSVDNNEQLWILDTGAEMTVIDKEYADRLGIQSHGELKGRGVQEVVNVSFVELPSYKIKGITFKNQKAVTLDIAPLFKKWGYDAVGILGYDFLSRFITRIDYANELISFYEPDHFEYSGTGKVVGAPMVRNIFSIPLTVNKKYSGMWTVDIGAGGLSFCYPFAKENGLLHIAGIETMGMGAGGAFLKKTAQFENLEIASFTINNPVIDIPIHEGKGAFSSQETAGNLGNEILERFIVYFDYANQQMIFEKGELFDSPYTYDQSGMQLEFSDEKAIRVAFVISNSPADKKGVKKGDRLISINGIAVENFKSLFAIRGLFCDESGTVYKVIFEREGKTRDVKLKLKDLF